MRLRRKVFQPRLRLIEVDSHRYSHLSEDRPASRGAPTRKGQDGHGVPCPYNKSNRTAGFTGPIVIAELGRSPSKLRVNVLRPYK